MRAGRWLEPRYTSREVLEKDFAGIDFNALQVLCPGCKAPVRLSRKHPAGRIAGWCERCARAVAP